MKTIVLSLGGSLIVPDEIDVAFLIKFKEVLLNFSKLGNRIIIVCGGGRTARKYITAANNINKCSDKNLDWIGIKSTQLNAEIIRAIFGKDAYKEVVPDFNKTDIKFKILIAAGYLPGCSTDYDAVMWAKNYNADYLINLTDVDYVYDKSPRRHPDAKPLPKLTWRQMQKIVGTKWEAGMQFPFDPIATKIAGKLKMRVAFLNGKNIDNFENFINGKTFIGSVIE